MGSQSSLWLIPGGECPTGSSVPSRVPAGGPPPAGETEPPADDACVTAGAVTFPPPSTSYKEGNQNTLLLQFLLILLDNHITINSFNTWDWLLSLLLNSS